LSRDSAEAPEAAPTTRIGFARALGFFFAGEAGAFVLPNPRNPRIRTLLLAVAID